MTSTSTHDVTGTARRLVRNPWLRTAAFAVAYAVAVAAGRATRPDDAPLALVWPAAAVAFLWLATSYGSRRLAVDAVLLGGIAVAGHALTGAAPVLAISFGLANVAQALIICLVFVELQRRRQRPRWRLRRPVDLWLLLVACFAGATASAVLGPVAAWVALGADVPPITLTWALRNASNAFVLAVLPLRLADRERPMLQRSRRDLLEMVVAVVALAASYGVVFGLEQRMPLEYLLLLLSVWIALRFDTTVVAAHVLLAGFSVVGGTLAARGPFIETDPAGSLLLAQAFVTVLAVVALVLALYRDERQQLVDQLDEALQAMEQQSSLLGVVLDTVDVGVVACDADGRLSLFNRAARAFHGGAEDANVPPEQWARRFDLYREDGTELPPAEVPLFRALRDGEVQDAVIRIIPEGLPSLVLRADGRRLYDDEGTVTGAVVAMKDVTALRASERRFRAAFDQRPTPLARLSPDGTIEQVNTALCRFLSATRETLLGRPLADVLHPDDRGHLRVACSGAGGGSAVEVRLLGPQGSVTWCEVATTVETTGEHPHVLVQLVDVHGRKVHEQALTDSVERDSLTRLGNRRALDRRLAELLHPAGGPGATLFFIDLDGFKDVNDRYGHQAGDAVLRAVAGRLSAMIRSEDVAVRLGGDEFVLVCPSPPEHVEAFAVRLAQRIWERLVAPVGHGGVELTVGASIGASTAAAGDDPATLLAEADRRMYATKQQRRPAAGAALVRV